MITRSPSAPGRPPNRSLDRPEAHVTARSWPRRSTHVEAHLEDTLGRLAELVRIPSVSAEGFPPAEVRRSAEAMAALLRDAGVENVQVLEIPGVHPYVYGDWLTRRARRPSCSTGTTTCSRAGRPEKWLSPAVRADGARRRLYGRGAADDKGGLHDPRGGASAPSSRPRARLPVNVRFVIEGEEEIGSREPRAAS